MCLLCPPNLSESEAQEEEEDGEVMQILDEESEVEEGEEGPDTTKEEEKKEKAEPAPSGKVDKFSDDLLSEEEGIDWDTSFQKEFETEENEVVTPSKKYEDLFYTIPSVTLIRKEDIFELNATDLSSASEKAPGIHMIHIQDSSPSPVMRGLYGNRLQLLFDGIRLTDTLSPAGMDYTSGLVDTFSLNSMELVNGPSVTLYGTSALGGVINYIPRSLRISPFISKATAARGFFRYSTLNASFVTHADTTLHTFDSGLHAGVTFEDYGSLTSGGERQSFTGYDRASLNFTAAKHFLPSHKLKLAYFFTRTTETDRHIPASVEKDYLNWDFHERHLVYIRYSGEDVSVLRNLEVTGGFQLFREKLLYTFTGIPEGCKPDMDRITTGSLFGMLHLSANLGGWGSLLYGTDYYFDRVNTTSTLTEVISSETSITLPAERGLFEPEAKASNFEHYALMELYFLKPVLISLGGRAVWNYVDVAMSDTSHLFGGGAQFEMRIPIVSKLKSTKFITLSDVLAFNVIASYVSRPPTLDELSAVRTIPEGILYGNPDLENEQMVGAQGGFKWNAGLLDGLLYYSYNHFDTMILVKPLEEEAGEYGYKYDLCAHGFMCWINGNAEKADLHSLELLNQFNIKNFLHIGLLLNYTNGTQENYAGDREPMSYIPPLNGAVWIKALYNRYGLWGELRLKWALRQKNLSLRDLNDPAICGRTGECDAADWYLLLTFRGGVKITNRFLLSFAFHNLINRLQKTYGSILYGPGIGASVSIEVRL